jgi:hypothetical protein
MYHTQDETASHYLATGALNNTLTTEYVALSFESMPSSTIKHVFNDGLAYGV